MKNTIWGLHQPQSKQSWNEDTTILYLDKLGQELRYFHRAFSRCQNHRKFLRRALNKEWILVSYLISRLIDAEQARSSRVLGKLRPKLIDRSLYVLAECSPWERIGVAVENLREKTLARIDLVHKQEQAVEMSQKLAGLIATKYSPQRFIRHSELRNVPGTQLQRLAKFFFSKRVYQLILEPILRDLLDEYCDALSRGEYGKALWVRVRGYWSFWSAVIAQAPISVVKKIYQVWKMIP
jgi:hypothetical protein